MEVAGAPHLPVVPFLAQPVAYKRIAVLYPMPEPTALVGRRRDLITGPAWSPRQPHRGVFVVPDRLRPIENAPRGIGSEACWTNNGMYPLNAENALVTTKIHAGKARDVIRTHTGTYLACAPSGKFMSSSRVRRIFRITKEAGRSGTA